MSYINKTLQFKNRELSNSPNKSHSNTSVNLTSPPDNKYQRESYEELLSLNNSIFYGIYS